jgi:hypothetical protein
MSDNPVESLPAEEARDTVSRPLITLLALAATLVAAIAVWRILRPEPEPADPATVSAVNGSPSHDPTTSPVLLVEKLPIRVSPDRMHGRSKGTDPQKFLDDFGRAVIPYREDRFEDAVKEMRGLAAGYKEAPEPPLYEGVSLLMLKRNPDAVKALERARKLSGKGEFAREAEYYHALSLVLAGRPAGRGAVQRICEGDGPYKAQSCQTLKSLSPRR